MRYVVAISILFIFFVNTNLLAQSWDANELESSSIRQYYAGSWDSLIVNVKTAFKNKIDYPTLHYRLATAYFYKGNYEDAQFQFEQYLITYYLDVTAQEMVYYCILYQGFPIEAREYLSDKSDYLKKRLLYKKTRTKEFLYSEAAIKTSSVDSIGNIPYLNIGLSYNSMSHNYVPTERITLYHSFSALSQKSYWGAFNQRYHYTSVNNYLGKNTSISVAYNYSVLKINTQRSEDSSFAAINGFDTYNQKLSYKSINKNNIHTFYLGLDKKIKRWNFHPYVSLFLSKNHTIDTSTYAYSYEPETKYIFTNDTTITERQIQTGLNFSFTTFNSKLSTGLNTGFILNDIENKFIFKPWINLGISSKLYLKSSFLYSKTPNTIEDNATIVNNATDITNWRFEIMPTYYLNQTIHCFLLFQKDQRVDAINQSNYSFNTFLGGVKINF